MKRPFLLKPVGKDYLWGGNRLNDDFNLKLSVTPLAEAWLCSTHPNGESIIKDFSNSSISLSEVLNRNPELLGTHAKGLVNKGLPILVKLIDAKQQLSVQVHPNDEYALRVEGELGKTEMWYILDAKPGAQLVYGFNRDVEANKIKESIEAGTVESLLNHVEVHTGDLFFIEPGTVHAIGAGILLAEIQESSNITYRLYDYDRVDKNGNKRELHVDKALEVMNMKSSSYPRQPMRVLKYRSGSASELLTRCRYFQVERLLLNTEGRVMPSFRAVNNSFHALVVIDGCGVLYGADVMIPFFKGDCIFVPADSIELKLHGRAELLDISC